MMKIMLMLRLIAAAVGDYTGVRDDAHAAEGADDDDYGNDDDHGDYDADDGNGGVQASRQ